MKKYFILILFLGLAIPLTLAAGPYDPKAPFAARASVCNPAGIAATCTNYNVLDSVALGAAAALRTISKSVDGYSKLQAYVGLTDANTDCTTMTATCYCSLDGGTLWGALPSRSVTAGASTVTPLVDTLPRASAIAGQGLEYGIFGCTNFRCVYAGISACSEDPIVVQWSLSVGK